MVKAKRQGTNARRKAPAPIYDSDDERAYAGEAVPDKASADYFHDEVDTFHANKEKLLLENGAAYRNDDSGESEEEVMAFSDSDEEAMYEAQLNRLRVSKASEELASDIEEGQPDKDFPDDRAWGKLKSKFYGADVQDEQDIEFSGSEDGVAALEEQEALSLQKKMAEQLDDDDFGLSALQALAKEPEDKKEDIADKVAKDVSRLSKREKRELLKKESPELLDILKDYKAKLSEYIEILAPMLKLIEDGRISATSGGAAYVKTKSSLILNYCTNVQFYLQLKSKQVAVRNHPVIKRLVQYRNLMKQLVPVETNLGPELNTILRRLGAGEEIKPQNTLLQPKRRTRMIVINRPTNAKMLQSSTGQAGSSSDDEQERPSAPKNGQVSSYETKSEKEALEFYRMMRPGAAVAGKDSFRDERATAPKGIEGPGDNVNDEESDGQDEDNDEVNDVSSKRAVSYQIVKNRGLTPRRKKEYKNPRVKHRIKYQKAKVRRKGQVREPRKELQRYGGEISGIRAGIKRSIKLKC